jgi:hypothetical protein
MSTLNDVRASLCCRGMRQFEQAAAASRYRVKLLVGKLLELFLRYFLKLYSRSS